MSNSKFDNHPIPLWMKDCERKRLADSLTSVLQQVSDDWDIQDSHKAVSAFEKWAYHLIDMDKLGTRRAFDKEMAFTFQVTQDVHSDELLDLLLEHHPEKWNYIRHVMMSDPVVDIVYDFAQHHKDWVRLTFNNINIVRTWQELNGEDVVPNEELAKKKSICTSRSFNGMIGDIETLRTHVSNYAARCAEKLRMQNTVASIVGVFLNTNAFREDLPQYWNFLEQRLITPTSSSITIIQTANEVLKKIFREGYQYKKAGVIVMGIGADSPIQQDLFDINAEQFQKMKRLDEVVDRINRLHGSETIVLGSQQYTQKNGKGKADVFANAIKHDFRSPSPTTRWSEVIRLNSNAKKKDDK